MGKVPESSELGSGTPDKADHPAVSDAYPRLPTELLVLAQNGAAISVAACTSDGRPLVGLGFGCRSDAGGCLRILLGRKANERLLDAVKEGSALAVTFTGTRDHTAFQVKAAGARLGGACLDDRPEIERQISLLRDGLVTIGFTPRQAEGYTSIDLNDLASIVMRPEKIFNQTPGPGAGAEVTS
ncbi:hypothetical protein LZA78_02420 [Sinirhodobacter sp. WL0062]|uniref:Pyridoxamine 5'-phosphate oxidase putative domain-containing protein n=1 Tax=Rhodobacter flavimaris TaxID=2907145 RepID=A0ABS8YV13_9RHOB|nr:hypothetical protein [Sinirhodobacter sp. WL0062]MCE5972347.1 hypothetical protein [Sinirhodobacter sp. WL0062]